MDRPQAIGDRNGPAGGKPSHTAPGLFNDRRRRVTGAGGRRVQPRWWADASADRWAAFDRCTRPLACVTIVEEAGGYALVVETVVPEARLAVSSSYLADLAGETAVSHMRLVSGRRSRFRQRVVDRLAGQTHARGCLLDHASELRAAAAEQLGDTGVLELAEAAFAEAPGRPSARPGSRAG
jgi:hypothetical protein